MIEVEEVLRLGKVIVVCGEVAIGLLLLVDDLVAICKSASDKRSNCVLHIFSVFDYKMANFDVPFIR